MFLSGLFICFLSLVSATVYAADGSMLSFCVALISIAVGAGLAIPAAVKPEREEKQ